MIKRYEVEEIIRNALTDIDGGISKPDDNGNRTVFEAKVERDGNGDLIFTFKEDCTLDDYVQYKINIEWIH